MKATGIVRKVDDLGRVVLPMELRKTFGIKEGDPLEIYVDGSHIILKQYRGMGCVFCGTVSDVQVEGKPVCKECIGLIKAIKAE
jgi:transcriptional pleiotropic regulator of transition state genes